MYKLIPYHCPSERQKSVHSNPILSCSDNINRTHKPCNTIGPAFTALMYLPFIMDKAAAIGVGFPTDAAMPLPLPARIK